MKLLPVVLVFSAAYFCEALRERFQPSQSPPPTPAANVPERIESPSNTPYIAMAPAKMVSGGVMNDKAKSLPQPGYPAAARAVRASGDVTVEIVVDEKGKVVAASAASGHPLLRVASEQAARKAEFEPTVLGGKAVKVSGMLIYHFTP